jgi:hypothetical protein
MIKNIFNDTYNITILNMIQIKYFNLKCFINYYLLLIKFI